MPGTIRIHFSRGQVVGYGVGDYIFGRHPIGRFEVGQIALVFPGDIVVNDPGDDRTADFVDTFPGTFINVEQLGRRVQFNVKDISEIVIAA